MKGHRLLSLFSFAVGGILMLSLGTESAIAQATKPDARIATGGARGRVLGDLQLHFGYWPFWNSGNLERTSSSFKHALRHDVRQFPAGLGSCAKTGPGCWSGVDLNLRDPSSRPLLWWSAEFSFLRRLRHGRGLVKSSLRVTPHYRLLETPASPSIGMPTLPEYASATKKYGQFFAKEVETTVRGA
jgi:hypothetical protein